MKFLIELLLELFEKSENICFNSVIKQEIMCDNERKNEKKIFI